MWNLPGQGMEPMSSALAGTFLTTGPPGKPLKGIFEYKKNNYPEGNYDGQTSDKESLCIACIAYYNALVV